GKFTDVFLERGARTFLSAAASKPSKALRLCDPVGHSGIAADKNVRAPCWFRPRGTEDKRARRSLRRMRFEFATATRIIFGAGTLREIGRLAKELGQRALLVTGRNLSRVEPLCA